MNLTDKLPQLADGKFVYAWAKLWTEQEVEHVFRISCYGPIRVFVNDVLMFQSNQRDDVLPKNRSDFRVSLRKGWNYFVLECNKTATGCGAKFGTGSVKGAPLHFLTPTQEREGQEGWIYSEPQDKRWYAPKPEEAELAGYPASDSFSIETLLSETAAQVRWYPELAWPQEQAANGCFARIMGSESEQGQYAFAWTKLDSRGYGARQVTLKGAYVGPCAIYLDGKAVYESTDSKGSFQLPLTLPFGQHDLVVRSQRAEEAWGIRFEPFAADESVRLLKPYPVLGIEDPWLYAGPFSREALPVAQDMTRMDALVGQDEEKTYWRVDQLEAWVRPYLENALFGRWNYPLGVTLYGILETGKEFARADYVDYVAAHIGQCTALGEYSLWDVQQYGAPGTNHQLALIDSLDDCGSFGATMLQAYKERDMPGARAAADRIAEYITHVQDRLQDGMLYRRKGHSELMHDTVWCDDLYMSTPFLCRYYQLTGDTAYLDDAARQFLLYKQRLFMPERSIMHHVFNLRFNKPNTVPWGRGNGWVLFSLTELLAVMPEDHYLREEILAFFRQLCEGYLALQDSAGMWHQVLDDHESYAEASCTSMFVYAFSRGVRFGWLTEPQPYVEAVQKGFAAIASGCIDKHGNVYGVCRGSGYSFTPLYYKERLSWLLNDTHGIGIVLLAGIETMRLEHYLKAL